MLYLKGKILYTINMVVYKCERCKKKFDSRSAYDRHLERKILCLIKEDIVDEEIEKKNYCEICDKPFSRSDILKRHEKTKLHQRLLLLKETNQTKNNDINQPKNNNINLIKNNDTKQIMHDKNDIINNYQFISPFGNEEIDELTPEEKLNIFLSKINPIIEITLMTNLNPSMFKYHNIGFKDIRSGWGLIYNNKTWQKKDIQRIMNELLRSKKRDLLKIHDEIRECLSEELNDIIQDKLYEIEKIIDGREKYYYGFRIKLIAKLKYEFTIKKHLVEEAIKKSGNQIIDNYRTKTNEIPKPVLKKGYTMERFIKEINQKKELFKKIYINKEIAMDLLQRLDIINKDEIQSIEKLIDQTKDMDTLNIIIRSLNKAYCCHNELNSKILENKIKDEKTNAIF
jgi:hypothetical protein